MRTGSKLCYLLAVAAMSLIAGCGGGSGSSSSPFVPPSGRSDEPATARFHVDTTTGQVDVTSLGMDDGGRGASRAVYTGAAISMTSSTLLDQPGDVGRKVLNVTIRNRSGETIGYTPSGSQVGYRFVFSDFTNVASLSDLRPNTIVSTTAGTSAASFADGPAGSAAFSEPRGVVSDSSGNLYVCDTSNQRVRKIAGSFVSTLAGNGTAADVDGIGTSARLSSPDGVAIDPRNGILVVTESVGQRVRRIDPATGKVTTVAGTGATAGDVGASPVAGNLATFNIPRGVTVDSSGNIYVVEEGGNRIRKIVQTGGDPTQSSSYTVTVLAGSTTGASGYADGVGTAALFFSPWGITTDGTGYLYVSDRGGRRIRRASSSGGEVTTVAGTGSTGETDGMGSTATLNAPCGIAWTNGCLLVSDAGGQTLRQVRLVAGAVPTSASSWAVQTVAGTSGATGSADGTGSAATFSTPRQVCVGPLGELYVADSLNNKVRRVVPSGAPFPLGSIGSGTTPPTEPVTLANATGIVPNTGRPYIDYSGSFSSGGALGPVPWTFIIPQGVTAFEFTVTVEGASSSLAPPTAVSNAGPTGVGSPDVLVRTMSGSPGHAGFVNGPGAQAMFVLPSGVASDGYGGLLIADSGANSIRRIMPAVTSGPATLATTVAGVDGTSPANFADGTGDVATFNGPMGVAAVPGGATLYVADTANNRIRRITRAGYPDTSDPAKWTVTTIAGSPTGAAGKEDGRGDQASFNGPTGIALDAGGNLYVTEYAGRRVRRLTYQAGDASLATSWRVTLVAGDNSAAAGASGTTDGTGAAARFAGPAGIAVDAAGSLYVADALNDRIRKIAPGGVVTTLAGPTGADVTGYADGTGTAARFNRPRGVAVDTAGYVYVTDLLNYRVRRISPTGVVTTVAGTGAQSFVDGVGSVATFDHPDGIAVDASGTLYIADTACIRTVQRVIRQGTQ